MGSARYGSFTFTPAGGYGSIAKTGSVTVGYATAILFARTPRGTTLYTSPEYRYRNKRNVAGSGTQNGKGDANGYGYGSSSGEYVTGTDAGFRTASITEGTRTGSSFVTNGSVTAAYALETTYGMKLVRDHLNLDLYPHLALLFKPLPLQLVVSGQLSFIGS